jgi:hypothetical protein
MPLITTLAGARAAVGAIRALRSTGMRVGACRTTWAGGAGMIARLALEDGTIFTGTGLRRTGTAHRRGGLQHRA